MTSYPFLYLLGVGVGVPVQVGLSVSLKGYRENKQYVCLSFNYRVRKTSLGWWWRGQESNIILPPQQ